MVISARACSCSCCAGEKKEPEPFFTYTDQRDALEVFSGLSDEELLETLHSEYSQSDAALRFIEIGDCRFGTDRWIISALSDTDPGEFLAYIQTTSEEPTGKVADYAYQFSVWQKDPDLVPLRDWTIDKITVYRASSNSIIQNQKALTPKSDWSSSVDYALHKYQNGIFDFSCYFDELILTEKDHSDLLTELGNYAKANENYVKSDSIPDYYTKGYVFCVSFKENTNLVWMVEYDNDEIIAGLHWDEELKCLYFDDGYFPIGPEMMRYLFGKQIINFPLKVGRINGNPPRVAEGFYSFEDVPEDEWQQYWNEVYADIRQKVE